MTTSRRCWLEVSTCDRTRSRTLYSRTRSGQGTGPLERRDCRRWGSPAARPHGAVSTEASSVGGTVSAGRTIGTTRRGESGDPGAQRPPQADGTETTEKTGHHVGDRIEAGPDLQQAQRLVAESAVRGERTAEADPDCCREGGGELRGERGQAAENERANHVDAQRSPREKAVVAGLDRPVGEGARPRPQGRSRGAPHHRHGRGSGGPRRRVQAAPVVRASVAPANVATSAAATVAAR